MRNINWCVSPGEHWAIIGLNGSGKTTLLQLLNGYATLSAGEMHVLGKQYGSYDWRKLRREIGFISSALQERFYTTETAEEIVLSGMFATIGLYDRPEATDAERALSLLEQLKCGHAAKQPYIELSQGEKQKVLIARALINAPRLLIMDEPCIGLDIFSREHILSAIETLGGQASAPTMLYVSHHIEEILPVFTHTLLLRQGEVHSAGEISKVLTAANLSSFFNTSVDVQWRKHRAWIHI
ncbi:MAG: ATP-binding cassette domain-containing protein [Nitrospirota bacterium]